MKLKDKVAVITGATSGIGKACAILFAQEGAKVVVAGLDENKGNEVATQIGGVFFKTDVAKPEDLKRLVEETIHRFERVDILLNNAGVYTPALLEDASEELITKTLDINLKAVILGSKYAVTEMMKQGGGVILSTASSLGLTGEPESVVYCATKAGVINMTKALALENARRNIRVNCICPGPIDTPLLRQGLKPGEAEKYRELNPMGRFGTPEEVAKVALFLVSDDASYVTGAAWMVDGGEAA